MHRSNSNHVYSSGISVPCCLCVESRNAKEPLLIRLLSRIRPATIRNENYSLIHWCPAEMNSRKIVDFQEKWISHSIPIIIQISEIHNNYSNHCRYSRTLFLGMTPSAEMQHCWNPPNRETQIPRYKFKLKQNSIWICTARYQWFSIWRISRTQHSQWNLS